MRKIVVSLFALGVMAALPAHAKEPPAAPANAIVKADWDDWHGGWRDHYWGRHYWRRHVYRDHDDWRWRRYHRWWR
ncbi:MAG: hypothetical protein WBX25_24190 [Rhodomicrobium sp.]